MTTRFRVSATTVWPLEQWRRLAWGAAAFLLSVSTAWAVPQGGEIVRGEGKISMSNPYTLRIFQGSDSMAIDWTSFNIAANERVVFEQPSSTASALNRIFDQNPSQIFGVIDANGRVFLINPNGMVFGRSAQINLNSLVASSLGMSVDDFMAGNYTLEALADHNGGTIINRGTIQAADGGSIALIGNAVINEGVLVANYGSVNLGAGRAATLDFTGEGLMLFTLDEGAIADDSGLAGAVHNSGGIFADGGQVLLTASAANDVLSSVVNNSGVIRAGRIDDTGGVIRLVADGGAAVNSGELDARGLTSGDTGGSIAMLGDSVSLQSGAIVDASGPAGGGDIRLGGDFHGAGELQTAQFTDIEAGVTIAANAEVAGDGGTVVVWSDDTTTFRGNINAQGGANGGDGGLVEVSGKRNLLYRGQTDTRAAQGEFGTLILDPGEIIVCTSGEADCAVPDQMNTWEDALLSAMLEMGDVVLSADATNSGTHNITFSAGADITWASATALTLLAGSDVVLGGTINAVRGTVDIFFGMMEAGVFTLESTAVITAADIIITGGDFGDTFNIGAALVGRLGGGAGDDIFIIDSVMAGTLSGGAGDDIFDIRDGGQIDDIDGGIDSDTLTYENRSPPVSVTLTFVGAEGYSGIGTGITNTFAGIDVVTGSGAGNMLTGLDAMATWTLLAADANTYASGGFTLDFSGFESLVGGSADDTFAVNVDPTVVTSVDGGAGLSGVATDLLTYAGFGGPVAVTLNAAGGTGYGGTEAALGTFANIDNVIGTGAGDVLTGLNAMATWTLLTADANTYASGGFTLDFSGFENLVGGTADDTFAVNTDPTVVTSVDGGAGLSGVATDLLTYAGFAGPVAVTLNAAGGTGYDGTEAALGTFANIDNLIGTGAGDVLTGWDAMATWTLLAADANTYASGGFTLDFSGFESLVGGTADDTFAVNTDPTVVTSVDGGAGLSGVATDLLTYAGFAGPVAVTLNAAGGMGYAGTEATLGTFANIENLIGTGVADTLTGLNAMATWTLLAADANTYASGGFTLDFSGFESLVGGSADDTFAVNVDPTVVTSVDGGAGLSGVATDLLTYAGFGGPVAVTLNAAGGTGYGGTEAALGTFANIDNVIGTGAGDVLTGLNAMATWTLLAADANTYASGGFTLAFSGFENLVGGTADDTFAVNTDPTVVTSVDGGAGLSGVATDLLTYAGFAGPVAVTLNAAGGTGYDGTEAALGTFANIDNLIGTGAGDVLTGLDAMATWTLLAADANTYASGGFTLDFSGFESLVGGTADDTFAVNTDPTVVTSVDGGAGLSGVATDLLTYAGFAGPVAVTLNAAGGTGYAGTEATLGTFANIENLIGTGVADTLTGLNAMATWTLLAADANTYASGGFTLDFSGFESLVGGSADDTFAVNVDPTVVTSVDGGAGLSGVATDLLTYAGFGGPVAVTLNAAGGTGYGGTEAALGTFANIDNVIGTGAGDVLTGLNAMATWTLLAADANTYASGGFTLAFSGFENLVGGTADDTFAVNADPTVVTSVDGGAEITADTLQGPDAGGTWTVNIDGSLTAPFSVGNISNIEQFVGGDGVDIFDIGFNYTGNLSGGGGDDIFNLIAGIVTGTLFGNDDADSFFVTNGSATLIDGGAGNDTLYGNDMANSWLVDALYGGSLNLDAFTGIENLVGGSDDDEFDIRGAGVVDSIVGGDAVTGDSLTYEFFGGPAMVTLTGVDALGFGGMGSGLAPGGSFAGIDVVTGSGAGNMLTGLDAMATWTLLAADANTYASGGFTLDFSGFESLVGGSANDTFAVNTDPTVVTSVDGGAGLSGVATDLLTYAGFGGPVAVTLNAAGGTGYGGTEAALGTFANIDNVIGTGAGDTLTGLNAMATWTLLAADANTYASGGFTLAFSGFESLVGGTANDTFAVNVDPTVVTSVDGGAEITADTLQGPDAGGTWTVNIDGSLTAPFSVGNISNIEQFVGGDGVDIFDIGFNYTGNLSGGGGDDIFNLIAGIVTGTLFGNDDADSFFVTNGSATLIDGGAGNDTLYGNDMANSWLVDALYGGSLNLDAFTGIENLVGGSDDDEFDIRGAGVVDSIVGGDAVTGDSLTYEFFGGPAMVTLTGVDALGFGGMGSGLAPGGSFAGIDVVTGSGAGNMLTGLDAMATWTLLAADANTYASGGFTLDFSGFESLVGGSANDTFAVNVDPTVVTSVDGGAGLSGVATDLLTYAGFGGPVAVTLNAAGGTGYGGTEAALGTFANIDSVIGTGAGDTLTGLNAMATWTLLAADANTYASGGFTLAFSGFESLVGGTADDTFAVNVDPTVVTSVDGGAGLSGVATDLLTYAGFAGPVAVTFNAAGGTGYGGTEAALGTFANIENLIGTGAGDVLTGLDAMATWTLLAADANTYASGGFTLDFSGFESLVGGTANDTFAVNTDPTVVTSVDGGAGLSGVATDLLTYAGFAGPVAVTLNAAGGMGYAGTEATLGTFANIENLIGTGVADTLTGLNAMATWTLLAADANTYASGGFTLAFSGFESLVGGTADDTFAVNVDPTVVTSVDGGAGLSGDATDLLTYAGFAGPVAVTLNTAAATGYAGTEAALGTFANIENVIGTGAGDTLTGLNAMATWTLLAADANTYASGGFTLDFSGFENLVGGTANDTFAVNADPTVVTSVDGGAGLSGVATDLLTYAGFAGPVAVTLNTAAATGYAGTEAALGTFANIDNLIGTGAGDTLTGLNAMAIWTLLAGSDSYSSGGFDLEFSDIENLVGGLDDDLFAVFGGLVNSIDGGFGFDELTYAGFGSTVAVTLTADNASGFSGLGNAIGTFAGIDYVAGSGLSGDTLTGLNADATWTLGDGILRGGGSSNTYSNGGELGFTDFENLTGGTGNDTFVVTPNPVPMVTLSDLGGNDELSYAGFGGAITVTLTAGAADGYSGLATGITSFSGIDSVVGSGLVDTLTGLDADATWMLMAMDANTYSSGGFMLDFSGFENFNGGSMVDTFQVDALPTAMDVTIAAGGGNDLIQIGTNDVGVAGTLTFDGGADNDSLQTAGGTVMAAVLSIIDIESIGISAADRFLTSVTSLQLSGIGDAFIGEEGDIDLNGVVASGNFDLSAAGMVTDTAALDVGGSTAITGNTGIVLDNAANIFGGPLSLTTNADATIAAASDVTLDDSVIGDNLSVTTAGALMVDGAVTAGANVGLMAGGTIAQGAGGAINANALTATASGGIVLGGANNVTNFSAANTGSGNITLANTGALTLSSISQSGGGDVNVTNDGGALTLAGNLSNSAGDVTLSVDGAITQNSGIIEAASLTAMSNGGLTLGGGNIIAEFGGMNANGNVIINNTVALELLGYAQSGGGSFTLDNVGTITQTGALTTNGGEILIETTSGNILLTLLDADDGMVTVVAMGNIYNEDMVGPGQAVIESDNIMLTATGEVGRSGDTLFVTAFSSKGNSLIVNEGTGGSVDILKEFTTFESLISATRDPLNQRVRARGTVLSTGLVQLVLDAAAFEPGVTRYEFVEPSLLLPCDQLVEDDPRCSE